MTLKDELIAIGEAQLTSVAIADQEKGIAVRVDKVFMPENAYRI